MSGGRDVEVSDSCHSMAAFHSCSSSLQSVKDIWESFSKPVIPKPHMAGDVNWAAITKVGNLLGNGLRCSMLAFPRQKDLDVEDNAVVRY